MVSQCSEKTKLPALILMKLAMSHLLLVIYNKQGFWHCLTCVTPTSSTPFQTQISWLSTLEVNLPLQEEVPWFSPMHPVGEVSSGAVKGEASPPCVFMGSQWWFTELALEQVMLSSILSAWADKHFTLHLLFPLSQRAAFFLVSHQQIHRYRWPVWEDGAPRAQLLLLQLWSTFGLL